jgi:hypothetical protein
MQLRSGKQIGGSKKVVPPRKAISSLSGKEKFVAHSKELLQHIADAPYDSMEKINCMYNMMKHASADKNIMFIKDHPKFISVVLGKCDYVQLNLIKLMTDSCPLSLEFKKSVLKLHKISTSTRLKYQKL